MDSGHYVGGIRWEINDVTSYREPLILPGELPAGVVVAFVGAPFLIMFARRRGVITL